MENIKSAPSPLNRIFLNPSLHSALSCHGSFSKTSRDMKYGCVRYYNKYGVTAAPAPPLLRWSQHPNLNSPVGIQLVTQRCYQDPRPTLISPTANRKKKSFIYLAQACFQMKKNPTLVPPAVFYCTKIMEPSVHGDCNTIQPIGCHRVDDLVISFKCKK